MILSKVVKIMPYILIWVAGIIGALGAICTSVPSFFCSANLRFQKECGGDVLRAAGPRPFFI